MSKSISYTQLDKTLRKLGAHLTAAETHGLLTGILSIGEHKPTGDTLRNTLLANLDCEQPSKSQWHVLSTATVQIAENLEKINCEFNMLLPNDEIELEKRIDALGYWCRGYLSGLGLAGVTPEHLRNDTVKELVQDLSKIAHVSIETDASEEDEANYFELVEYVRVAVQNIKLELTLGDHRRILH